MKMRVLAAGLTLLLASATWAASIASSEAAANENATAPAQAPEAAAAVSAPAAHPLAAYLALRPALPAKPAFFPPLVDSKAFVDRKAALLSSLFGLPPPPPAAPAPAAPGPVFPWFAPGFFAAKKNSFLTALMAAQAGAPYAAQQPPFAAQQPYAAQQPATPSRRAIFGVVPSGGAPPGLAVGPSVFAAKKAAFLQRLFEALNATEAPPTPAPAPLPSWLDLLDDAPQPDNSADAAAAAPQALGRVPLAASAPADPSAARAQFLSALFGGLGLPPPAPKPTIVPPGFWSPFALAKPTIVPPDFWVPAGKPSPAALYRAKVASFLGALFQQANATAAPQPPAATRRNVRAVEGTPEAAEEGSAVERRGALGGPFGGPFGAPFGGPFGGAFGPFGAGKPFGPTVDPKFFMDKKTAFLSQLFASKAASTADASGGDANPAPAPSFGPFAPYGFAPTPKPTIVPPDFWSPFAALKAPSPAATAFADKKAKFLSTLLALKATTTPAPPPPQQEEDPAEDDEEADFDDFLQELAERLTAPGAAALARRGLPPGSPDAALAQMAALKDAIVATANAILLAQKEAAAQQPAFPFAKGSYAAMKKGGPPPGVFSKKGGPPPGVFSKKGGPPGGGGGFPLWGGAAPTPDPTAPLQQRLQVLSQAFDSLAALERGASAALQTPSAPAPAPNADAAALLQLLRQAAAEGGAAPKGARKGKGARGPAARSLQFAVRQGQFSLPPGAEELLTAGGGATPGQQEGGGLRLQIKVPAA